MHVKTFSCTSVKLSLILNEFSYYVLHIVSLVIKFVCTKLKAWEWYIRGCTIIVQILTFHAWTVCKAKFLSRSYGTATRLHVWIYNYAKYNQYQLTCSISIQTSGIAAFHTNIWNRSYCSVWCSDPRIIKLWTTAKTVKLFASNKLHFRKVTTANMDTNLFTACWHD